MSARTRAEAALVMGGSGGIGGSVCRAFGEARWRVAVHCRHETDKAAQVGRRVTESGGEAVLCRADVGNPGEVSAMVMHLLKGWDRLDVLICSTGLASGRLLLRLPEPEWLETVRINLTGVFHCLRAVAPHMIDRRRGSIVVIGSYAGFHGRAGQTAYAAAKAGLLGLVRTAAKEWGSFGVRVNLVLPGLHATRLSEGAIPHQGQYADHLLGAPPRLLDIGRTIRDLSLLPAASGQVWNLDSRLL